MTAAFVLKDVANMARAGVCFNETSQNYGINSAILSNSSRGR